MWICVVCEMPQAFANETWIMCKNLINYAPQFSKICFVAIVSSAVLRLSSLFLLLCLSLCLKQLLSERHKCVCILCLLAFKKTIVCKSSGCVLIEACLASAQFANVCVRWFLCSTNVLATSFHFWRGHEVKCVENYEKQ